MTNLPIFLAIWIIPYLLCLISIYLDTEKGKTVKEYFGDDEDIKIFIFFPIINIIMVLVLFIYKADKRLNNKKYEKYSRITKRLSKRN